MTEIQITPLGQTATGCACSTAAAQPDGDRRATGGVSVAEYTVSGMTCGHCVASVTEELTALDGVAEVAVDLATGRVTVTSAAPLDPAAVAAAVDEAGYQLAS